jgi:hypothetical protein
MSTKQHREEGYVDGCDTAKWLRRQLWLDGLGFGCDLMALVVDGCGCG